MTKGKAQKKDLGRPAKSARRSPKGSHQEQMQRDTPEKKAQREREKTQREKETMRRPARGE